jgi:myo-inositol-1(or 4)-monophosphatase
MDWIQILDEATQSIKIEVTKLLRTVEAKKTLGVGAGGDETRKIDVTAENALIKTLEEHDVSCILISEEKGETKIGSRPPQAYLTVDPLDGTTNAIRGIPFIATSIAVSKTPQLSTVETTIVADILHDVTYMAQKGLGAFRNYQKITPSQQTTVEDAVIGIDFNTYKKQELTTQLNNLLAKTKHLRHLGANALELCYVADGTTDAFLDLRGKLRVTDMAAAYLIIKEAGGIITTSKGDALNAQLTPTQRISFIAAGNIEIYNNIMKLLISTE